MQLLSILELQVGAYIVPERGIRGHRRGIVILVRRGTNLVEMIRRDGLEACHKFISEGGDVGMSERGDAMRGRSSLVVVEMRSVVITSSHSPSKPLS